MDPTSMRKTSSLPGNEPQEDNRNHPDPLRPPSQASPEAPQQPQQPQQQPPLPPPEFWQDYFLSAGFPSGDQVRSSVGQGWSTLARVVRDVDEEKIKQHKEDIDTILVFAGLFSAVMTAFLVESYKNLSPDPTMIQTQLLQQIAAQSSSHPSNTTTASPAFTTTSDFQPSRNAIRVNVLWFTSLTLSLVSASLAILVKQWLREYLAGEYTSPQAHLRIRHFRAPGLRHWKVFELAATVPLLLQICLALFLIGLCFFTADVHSSIGHTTLPLVAGWGFLIVAATLSPIFSSRCPYKTSLFISILSGVRKRLFEFLRWLTNAGVSAVPYIPATKKWSYERLAYDEQDAVETDANDLDILVAVDSIQSDEHLLNIMWDALQQIQLGPAESVRFVKEILGNRLQVAIPNCEVAGLPRFLSLARLPTRFTTSIMLMLGDILENHFKEAILDTSHLGWPQWTYDCLYLLLSDIDIPLPAAVNQTFLRILMAEQAVSKPFIDIMKACVPHEDTFSRVLRRLQGVFRLGKQEHIMGALQYLVQRYFCANHHEVFHTLSDIARDHADDFTGYHRQELGEFLIQILTNRTPSPNQMWSVLFVTVQIILELLALSDGSWRSSVIKLFRHLSLTQANVLLLTPFAVGYNIRPDNELEFRQVDLDSILKMKPGAQELIIEAFISADGLERPQMVNSFAAHIVGQWRPPFQLGGSSNTWEPKPALIDALEACHLFIRLIATMKAQRMAIDTTTANELRDLFRTADKGLHAAARARKMQEGYSELAKDCLQQINSLDILSPPSHCDEEAYVAWAHSFPARETLFPDTFIEHLAAFLPKDADLKFSHRMCRLEILKRHRRDFAPGSVGIPRNVVPKETSP